MSTTTTREATVLPIKQVADTGTNPRGAIDREAESFLGFVEAIKEQGILQPILVGRRENGAHPVIAGFRRFAAAQDAGLKEVPALIADDLGAGSIAAALAENVAREDLSPVAEAEALHRLIQDGMTQVEAGKALGKSERWVRERLRLLSLPAGARDAFDERAVPLDTLVPVETVAKASPGLAEELVRHVAADEISAEELRRRPARAFGHMADDPYRPSKPGSPPVVAIGRQEWTPDRLPVPAKARKELDELWSALPVAPSSYRDRPEGFVFDEADADAARAYGCLVELEDTGITGTRSTEAFIVDPEWLVDRCKAKIPAMREAAEREAKKVEERKAASRRATGKPADERSKEERAKAREAEKREREEAHAANLELGSRVAKELARPKVDVDAMRLLAELVLADDAEGLARRASYADARLHEEERPKRGPGVKVRPAGNEEGERILRAALAKARTPQAILGVLLRYLVSARFSDETVAVQSLRRHTSVPGVDDEYRDEAVRIAGMIDALAQRAKVLPAAIRKRVEEDARERARLEAVAEERARKAEAAAELKVLRSLARLKSRQRGREDLIQKTSGAAVAGGAWIMRSEVARAVDRLVERRQVSEVEIKGKPGIKLNASGAKRAAAKGAKKKGGK